jgi:tetratricopeptide (TPR) repeat protein
MRRSAEFGGRRATSVASRKESRAARETLEEIESALDRVEAWVSDHPPLVIAIIAGILAVAAAVGGYQAYSHRRADRASAAIATVETDYLHAMGAPPGSYQVVEPANPETGRNTRKEYAQRFLDAAKKWSGTTAAVRARIEAGRLLEEAGDLDGAVAAWKQAADGSSAGSLMHALALVQLAHGLESQGHEDQAADAWQRAGSVEDYPGASLALAEAARCYADAGQDAKAVDAFKRAQSLAGPDVPLPPYVVARLRSLSAKQAGASGS